MLSILLGIVGTIIGLLIHYVRTISVLVDERGSIEKDPESSARYRWLYRVSEKMESAWPFVKAVETTKWVNLLSNIAFFVVVVLLVSAGLLQEFLIDYAGLFIIVAFILMSISNGSRSLETYRNIKPYLPVIFPAMMYQSMSILEAQNPSIAQQLLIPGHEFFETKLLATLVGFVIAFVIPYPMAKFDHWFSRFIAKSTLFFVRDFMRLGVKPENDIEISLRKAAKESIAVTLKIILAFIGALGYLTYQP